jgi:hypothetical protein
MRDLNHAFQDNSQKLANPKFMQTSTATRSQASAAAQEALASPLLQAKLVKQTSLSNKQQAGPQSPPLPPAM